MHWDIFIPAYLGKQPFPACVFFGLLRVLFFYVHPDCRPGYAKFVLKVSLGVNKNNALDFGMTGIFCSLRCLL